MTSFKNSLFLLALFALLGMACSKTATLSNTDDSINNIPADVSSVSKIDIRSLLDKMDFEAVQQMEFYQDALTEMRKESKIGAKIMEDPTTSGIDLDKNLYFAYHIDPKTIGNMFSYATVSLKDAAAFEAMLQAAGVDDISIQEGYKSASPQRKQVVAWNNDMAILGTAMSYMDTQPIIAKIFATDKTSSIASDPHFAKSMQGDHDMVSWFSSNAVAENADAKMAVGFMNIKPEALQNNYSYGYLDFLDGEIVSESQFELNDGISKDLRLFVKDNPKTNFSKYIPSENMGFGMTAALDLKGVNQVLSERPQAKSFINFALREYGINFDQIVDALGGDIFVAGYGKATDDYSDASGIFATDIRDQKVFDELLQVALETNVLRDAGDGMYQLGTLGKGVSARTNLMVHDGLLFIAENADMLASVKKDGGSSSDFSKDLKKLSRNKVFSMMTDFDIFKQAFNDFQEFGGRTMQFSSDRNNADFKMEFEDNNTNSLQQIMQMVNKAYLKEKAKENTPI